jgi:hypothetical protein
MKANTAVLSVLLLYEQSFMPFLLHYFDGHSTLAPFFWLLTQSVILAQLWYAMTVVVG